MTEQIKDANSNTSISNPLFSIVSCSNTRAVCCPIYLWLIQLTSFYIWLFCTIDYFGASFLRSLTSSGVG